MSRQTYPRIVDSTHKPKWDKLRVQHPKNAHHWQCCACPAPATHLVFVQVNWFRGDDEGPFKACADHKRDAAALLSSRPKEAA